MTFSLVARDSKSGQFVVSVCSSSPSVGARCAFARSGVGAVTSQNVTDPRLGPKLLDLLEKGYSAKEACDNVVASTEFADYRQLTLVDSHGSTATWSGTKTLGISAKAESQDIVSAGNLLDNPGVPNAIAEAFSAADVSLPLGQRAINAMKAGLQAGGEAGTVRSAALILVDKESWPLADLRVDWTKDGEPGPIDALQELWDIWAPQMQDYVTRCLYPNTAPSYGVPGDE